VGTEEVGACFGGDAGAGGAFLEYHGEGLAGAGFGCGVGGVGESLP